MAACKSLRSGSRWGISQLDLKPLETLQQNGRYPVRDNTGKYGTRTFTLHFWEEVISEYEIRIRSDLIHVTWSN